jgi:hypothetical protein
MFRFLASKDTGFLWAFQGRSKFSTAFPQAASLQGCIRAFKNKLALK